uniref:(northern house mosquito) hypothetical protein n=1 Tax=Culex pipiens TaxID=7175 RepID=A0A8D8HES5_CULPI
MIVTMMIRRGGGAVVPPPQSETFRAGTVRNGRPAFNSWHYQVVVATKSVGGKPLEYCFVTIASWEEKDLFVHLTAEVNRKRWGSLFGRQASPALDRVGMVP